MQAKKVKVDFINTRKKIYAANAMANEQSLRNVYCVGIAIVCLAKRVKNVLDCYLAYLAPFQG